MSSRLIQYRGLRGVLLALPLVALGGYAILAAGAGRSLLRWIKRTENATDSSIISTARQLLWLPARLPLRPLATAAAIAGMAVSVPAFAQEKREDEWAARQAEKATRLRPYEPSSLERRVDRIGHLLNATRRPVYPFIGSTFDGGGLALGPGFRVPYGDSGRIDAHVAWSTKNYKAAVGVVTLPTFANKRVGVELRANWLDAPNVAFYGTGNNSLESDRTDLFYRTTTVGVTTRVRAARFLSVGGGMDLIQMESGASAASRSLLAAKPGYRRTHAFAEFDSRQSPGYTTRGGLYRVDWSDYRQTNAGAFSFNRIDAEFQQFVPVLRENWVIALRALASTTSAGDDQDVPSVLLPDLGGSHMLRGYPAWRFRDRNRLLLTGEYRWKAGQFVDMALFIDAGKVAPRAKDLDFRNFRKTYGLGVSLHTPISTPARVELARTREGTSLLLSFSPSF